MRVLIFGATGGVGGHLVQGALQRGHQVSAFVRPGTDLAELGSLRVFEGDLFDPEAVSVAIAGQHAVFSALGPRTLKPEPVLAHGIANIIAAMHAQFVDRLIVVGAAGALYPAGKYQTPLSNLAFSLFRRTLLRHPFADQAAQEQLLAESDLDYTIVRPPRLTNAPGRGEYYVVPDGLPSSSRRLARADLAEFMLDQLTDPRFRGRGVYLASK